VRQPTKPTALGISAPKEKEKGVPGIDPGTPFAAIR
jgi:hypothetical protein